MAQSLLSCASQLLYMQNPWKYVFKWQVFSQTEPQSAHPPGFCISMASTQGCLCPCKCKLKPLPATNDLLCHLQDTQGQLVTPTEEMVSLTGSHLVELQRKGGKSDPICCVRTVLRSWHRLWEYGVHMARGYLETAFPIPVKNKNHHSLQFSGNRSSHQLIEKMSRAGVCGTGACLLLELKLCHTFGYLWPKWIRLGTTQQSDMHIINPNNAGRDCKCCSKAWQGNKRVESEYILVHSPRAEACLTRWYMKAWRCRAASRLSRLPLIVFDHS